MSDQTRARWKTAGRSSLDFVKSHWELMLFLLLLMAVAAMYAWKEVAVNNTRDAIKVEAEKVISDQSASLLRLATIPFAWAVRTEMIRGNLDQVNQYLEAFVREPNVTQVVLANSEGIILLATDKRMQGSSLAGAFPASVLGVEKTTVIPLQGSLLSAAPIMGLNRKLGVLLVLYRQPTYAPSALGR